MSRKMVKRTTKVRKANRSLAGKRNMNSDDSQCAETAESDTRGYLDPPGIETAGGGRWDSFQDIFESHMRGHRE